MSRVLDVAWYLAVGILTLSVLTAFAALQWGVWSDWSDTSARVFMSAFFTAVASFVAIVAIAECD